MTTRATCVVLLLVGCRTRFEAVVCETTADCDKEYFCDTSVMRCLRIACASDDDCAAKYGYTCDVPNKLCILTTDGGTDGPVVCDRDEDGVEGSQCGGTDCDDDDPTRFPGNIEDCNGQDDDCDEATSDGTDADNDDYCASGGPAPCCTQSEVDCCDTDNAAHPGVTAYFVMADGETTCGGWDYNCSGTEEQETTTTASCACNPCTGTNGWAVVIPSCGQDGDFAVCGDLDCGNGCPLTSTPIAQGCH